MLLSLCGPFYLLLTNVGRDAGPDCASVMRAKGILRVSVKVSVPPQLSNQCQGARGVPTGNGIKAWRPPQGDVDITYHSTSPNN